MSPAVSRAMGIPSEAMIPTLTKAKPAMNFAAMTYHVRRGWVSRVSSVPSRCSSDTSRMVAGRDEERQQHRQPQADDRAQRRLRRDEQLPEAESGKESREDDQEDVPGRLIEVPLQVLLDYRQRSTPRRLTPQFWLLIVICIGLATVSGSGNVHTFVGEGAEELAKAQRLVVQLP